MSTPLHLNTVVKGSVGMLQEAAGGLRKGQQAAEQADEANHRARGNAQASWRGAGAGAFLDDLEPHLNNTRDLAATCEAYARAFDDLAGRWRSCATTWRRSAPWRSPVGCRCRARS